MILREMMTLYMAVHKMGTRELAKEVGLSPATVSRFLRGKGLELESAVRILAWMTSRT